ncbi:MAG: toll/interleukin-1 receptor domain-containing protein [Ignavibacteriae bacterium]|nr:toll/interleukin-1 receptor domain-containing protein [Ignavibacteriota bacterium]
MNNDVFISYSHEDKKWLEQLQRMLKPLLRSNPISVWDDTKIRPGTKWKSEIEKALESAEVAVLLVSSNFLASDFITDKEVPHLLDAAQTRGTKIIWVPITHCLWTETEIAAYQCALDPDVPLDGMDASEVNRSLVTICRAIKEALTPAEVPAEPAPEPRKKPQPANKKQQAVEVTEAFPPPPPQPQHAQFGGTWTSMDGSYSVVRQNGAQLQAEMFINVFGVPTKTAWGQGAVMGRQAYLDFADMYGNTGRTELTMSDDGASLTGVARYSNGFFSNVFATRTG